MPSEKKPTTNCPHCEGTGAFESECPRCKGSGFISFANNCPNCENGILYNVCLTVRRNYHHLF